MDNLRAQVQIRVGGSTLQAAAMPTCGASPAAPKASTACSTSNKAQLCATPPAAVQHSWQWRSGHCLPITQMSSPALVILQSCGGCRHRDCSLAASSLERRIPTAVPSLLEGAWDLGIACEARSACDVCAQLACHLVSAARASIHFAA